ncbi:hypothetical protein [Streptomyces gilvosporeus]|uniref:hypothetical protein n=1 Tax=Streptomyces gilvosporeus TaxID=553510 RepID=UPI00131A7B65|nr:hypothetical protein [Streptomyces gilvosporeus]
MSDTTPPEQQGHHQDGGEQPSPADELNRKQEELAEQVNRHFALLHGKGRTT